MVDQKIKVYSMQLGDLKNFVHNTAQPGDIAMSHHRETKRMYMYICTKENIGKNINPTWKMIDERAMWKHYFSGMSLEEKVDFLIDRYIQNIG